MITIINGIIIIIPIFFASHCHVLRAPLIVVGRFLLHPLLPSEQMAVHEREVFRGNDTISANPGCERVPGLGAT